MSAGCVADIDVAVSVFITFQRSLCKSLQVISKVLVLVAPVLVNITENDPQQEEQDIHRATYAT